MADKRFERIMRDEILVSAELCKRSLKQFVVGAWSTIEPSAFVDGRAIDAIVEHLEAVTFGQIRFLLINIPPRMSKSTIVSVLWPCWDWLHYPSEHFLCASYGLDLSTRDNRRKRILIESPWFQTRYSGIFSLADDQAAKRNIENNQQGRMLATSVGAATTGHGGGRLVLDDPHSAAEAHSASDRNAALRWFREVWSNRLNDQNKSAMVTVGQRVHDDDVSGYIIKDRPDWTKLILPSLYEPDRHCTTSIWTDWRKEEDELLWPERFSKKALDGLRRDLGAQGFAAQYQQIPVQSGGGQFKETWFRYYTRENDILKLITPNGITQILLSSCEILITVDLAISLKQSADFTVIAVWAISKERDLILLDRVRDRLDNPDQQRQITMLYHRWLPSSIQIESVAYQLSIVQSLRNLGLPIREYRPVRDKVSRASVASVYYESGKIYHPQSASWLEEWQGELLKFPLASHDDVVDVVSMACEQLVAGVSQWIWGWDNPEPMTQQQFESDCLADAFRKLDDYI